MAEQPELTTTSAVEDGTVSGVLPSADSFAIHYPAYASSDDRAFQTLGGLSEISKVRSLESNNLELRFRPDDPYSHPATGVLRPSASFLLKISKSRRQFQADGKDSPPRPQVEQLSADIVARVSQAYHFDGMADYQHVVAVHAAESSRRKRCRDFDMEPDSETDANIEPDAEDVLMLVPNLFSQKNMPENIVLNPSVNLFSRIIQKGVVEHRWELDIEPCLAISFDIENIPVKITWEEHISRNTDEWEWHIAVSKLFEERAIWPRRAIHERLLDDGLQVTEHQMRRVLFKTGYYFSTGPFGRFWIRKGYDPRKDPESRIYQRTDFRMHPELRYLLDWNISSKSKQKWKDICGFRLLPSKVFVCLQLFELDDDFIQQEIRKPSLQTSCSHTTGWFTWSMLNIFRLRVSIRYISIFPKGRSEDFLRSAIDSFEKAKKMEARSRYSEPEKEYQLVNRDLDILAEVPCPKSNDSEHKCEDVANNKVIEEEEAEEEEEEEAEEEEEEEAEEEEEINGYDSATVAGELGPSKLDAAFSQIGDSIPSDYLQEILRGFPLGKDVSQPDNGGDQSDGEYQIFEQDSDDDDST